MPPSTDISDLLETTLVMILAGGEGERLYPLTRHRTKAAVPFAGNYRIIDFTLSNCLNSGLRKILVLTQHKCDSLNKHIRLGWDVLHPELGGYIRTLPPQQRISSRWYQGTADAIYQNIYTLQQERPAHVLILSGDHVYQMDYRKILQFHAEQEADLTVSCAEMPLEEAARLGVISVDEEQRIVRFEEKPDLPVPVPGKEDRAFCSMGVYVFRAEMLVRRVIEDSKTEGNHDLGGNIVPAMLECGDRLCAYDLRTGRWKRSAYWRDIGTLDAYWSANMDFVREKPPFDPGDPDWPVRSYVRGRPPARIAGAQDKESAHALEIEQALICNGARICGARVRNSIIGPGVCIGAGSVIEDSVIMDEVFVGQNVRIRKAIVDKHNRIPDETQIGVCEGDDAARYTISEDGVVVVPKEMPFA